MDTNHTQKTWSAHIDSFSHVLKYKNRCKAMSDKLGLGTWRMCHFDWYGYEVLWHAFFQTKNNRDPLQLLSVGDSSKLQWPGSVCVPVSEQVSPSVWRSGTGDRGDSSDEGHCPGNRWEQKYVKTFHYFSNWNRSERASSTNFDVLNFYCRSRNWQN